jgi:cytochrome b
MENKTTLNKSILSKTKINLMLDIALFLVFLVVYEAKATGETVHEWLGVGMVVFIILHMLLHWQWVVHITQRFFQKIKTEPRINYMLNVGLFISFTTIIFSGLMISRSVLPFFGLATPDTPFWKMLHSLASDITLGLVALHIALHWQWLANAVKRYAIAPVRNYFGRKSRPVKPHSVQVKF